MRAKAEKAELEIAALERCLLRFDEVVQAWQQARRRVPRRCLALPSKLSSRLAVINERKKIQDALTAEIREALQELSRFDLAGSAPARSAQSRPGSKPPSELTVSQWADQNLRLSPEDSGEHGQYQSIRLNLRPIRYACIRPEW